MDFEKTLSEQKAAAHEDGEIMRLFSQLDDVRSGAMLAMVRALAAGADDDAAVAAGNAVLVKAGIPPVLITN